jgi:tetratricopeptide (TPR) repeat protein
VGKNVRGILVAEDLINLEDNMGMIVKNLSIIAAAAGAILFISLSGGCRKEESHNVAQSSGEVVTNEYANTQEPKKEVVLPGKMSAAGYYDYGVEHIKKGGFDEAIAAWEKVLELDPTMVNAYEKLGMAYYTQGRFDKAIEIYRKESELNPNNPKVYFNMGVVYRMNEQFDDAIKMQKKAISLEPKFASAFNELGLTFCKQRKLDEAIQAHKKALELDPNLGTAHNYLGVAYLLKGMNAEAEAEFSEFRKYDAGKDIFPSSHGSVH